MRVLTAIILALAPLATRAQSAAEFISLGDRDYLALQADAALGNYENAVRLEPDNYEALWKASRSAIDIGSFAGNAQRRATLFVSGEQYARSAIRSNPADAEGHFALARALGKTALTQSPRGRVRYATEIRAQALECLRSAPRHPGCLHVMGMWNAEVMRLSSVTRLIARNVLGGRVFATASWSEAVRYMEGSVAAEPDRIVHHVDLGEVYWDVGEKAKARVAFETALRLPVSDVNDLSYQEQARAGLNRR